MTEPNPLVAVAGNSPVDGWAGIWIAEDIEAIRADVESGSWVDTSIGAVSAGLDALAFVSDPIGSLLQYGAAWIIEHVRPLAKALDWLAGDPRQIVAHAQTWRNVAATMDARADDLDRAVRFDTGEWVGGAAEAYRRWTGLQRDAVRGLAGAAQTMAAITEGAGGLVAGVRTMVRDAIAVLVSRLIDYAAEELLSLGAATPLVVEQVSALCAACAVRIGKWLRGLLASLRRLHGLAGRMGEAIEALKQQLRRLHRAEEDAGLNRRGAKRGAGPIQFFTMDSVRSVAAKYGIDVSGLDISLGDVKYRGMCGETRRDGSVILYAPGFRSEEDLARTLEHERLHHDDLAAGMPFPVTAEEFGRWEDRAYDHEDDWWNGQPIRPGPRRR